MMETMTIAGHSVNRITANAYDAYNENERLDFHFLVSRNKVKALIFDSQTEGDDAYLYEFDAKTLEAAVKEAFLWKRE